MNWLLLFPAAVLLAGSAAPEGPGTHSQHVLAYDSDRQSIIVATGDRQETWGLAGDTWSLLSREGPEPRNKAGMAYDRPRQTIILFGGYSTGGEKYGDTWEWDGTRWRKIAVQSGPAPRSGHALCFHAGLGKTVLYGGIGKEMWTWDGSEWEQLPTPQHGPSSDSYNMMVYDSLRDRLVHHRKGETWEWDGREWTQVATTGPKRDYHALAFDPARGHVLLFGGTEYVKSEGDTWAWDGKEWAKLAGSGPPARQDHAMVYESSKKRVILFGGAGLREKPFRHFMTYDDVWTWEGLGWSKLDPGVDQASVTAIPPKSSEVASSGPQRLTMTPLGMKLDTTFRKEKLTVYIVKILMGRKPITRAVAPFNSLPAKTKAHAKKKGYEEGDLVKFTFGEKKGSGKMLSSTETW